MAYKKSHIPKVRDVLRKAEQAAMQETDRALREYAHVVRDDFTQRIKDQRFRSFQVVLYPESGTNLSPQWIERKALAGADPRTMIATGHYVRNILVHTRGPMRYRVGFDPRVRAVDLQGERVNITLQNVALIHEYGNARTPARPHWGPNLRRLQREKPAVRRTMQKRIDAAVARAVGARARIWKAQP